jgi:hypothetical protein
MNAYTVALFIHLLGVITLFIAIGLLQRVGARIRTAESVSELRLLMTFVQPTARMFPAAFILLLAGGLYMTNDLWSFTTSWVVVALVTLGLLAAAGSGFVGVRLARIGRSVVEGGDGPLPSSVRDATRDVALWAVLSAQNGAAIALLWLMATKPGWTASIVTVVGLAALGAVIGTAAARRSAVGRPST